MKPYTINKRSISTDLKPQQIQPRTISPEILAGKEYLEKIFMSVDLQLNDLNFTSPEASQFYNKYVMCSKEQSMILNENTISQNISSEWKKQRSLRITASKCYTLYTYSKSKNQNWDKKCNSYINSKPFFSKHTNYGVLNELNALKSYERDLKYSVAKLGLVVSPSACWLGCSPDGFDTTRNVLIEIKCPTLGEEKELEDMLLQVPYLNCSEGSFKLKKKHIYYGQIQLNLFILNAPSCDLVLYSKKSDKCAIICVPKDLEFLAELIPSLKKIYGSYILPFLCKNN